MGINIGDRSSIMPREDNHVPPSYQPPPPLHATHQPPYQMSGGGWMGVCLVESRNMVPEMGIIISSMVGQVWHVMELPIWEDIGVTWTMEMEVGAQTHVIR